MDVLDTKSEEYVTELSSFPRKLFNVVFCPQERKKIDFSKLNPMKLPFSKVKEKRCSNSSSAIGVSLFHVDYSAGKQTLLTAGLSKTPALFSLGFLLTVG